MSNLDREKFSEIIDDRENEKNDLEKENDKLISSQKEFDDLSSLSLLNNNDGEILEDLKMEDSFLNEIFFNDSLDSNSSIIYNSEESPIFNEKSYLESLNSDESNFDQEIYNSEENPIFNEQSYYENLSFKNEPLQSDIYKKQLFIKEELNFDNNEKVIFEENLTDDSYLKMQIDDKDKQVIFDETISNEIIEDEIINDEIAEEQEEVLEFEKDEPQDLFDFELVDASNDIEKLENDDEKIEFEQPPFEEYNLESHDEDVKFEDIDLNFDNEQDELPIIDVDSELTNLLDDIDFIEPTEHYEISFDEFKEEQKESENNDISLNDIEIEYVPSNEMDNFVLVNNEESKEKHDFIELSKDDFDIYKGVEVIETTDDVKNMFENFISINDDISSEFGDVEVINTNDHVESIDYSGYTIASYIQPNIVEEVKIDTKDERTIPNEYLNVETIYPGEIPSWYSKPIQPIVNNEINTNINQPNLVVNEKEVVSKSSEIPSIEEQLKKIKKPNLFRKYTVASTANLVILKSIDRLLNLTNSVIQRQKNK